MKMRAVLPIHGRLLAGVAAGVLMTSPPAAQEASSLLEPAAPAQLAEAGLRESRASGQQEPGGQGAVVSMPEGGWQGSAVAEAAAAEPVTQENGGMTPAFIDQFQPYQQMDAREEHASGSHIDRFTKNTIWMVTLPAAGEAVCYDFDSASEVPECLGRRWDIKLTGGSPVRLSTNSGSVGNGRAGVYRQASDKAAATMSSWRHLASWKSATRNPRTDQAIPDSLFVSDVSRGAFSGANAIQSAVYEYGLGGAGDQRLYPSYRVFLITSDAREASLHGTEQSPVFALQVIGYYGDSGQDAGHIRLRWVDRRAPANLRQATVDASRDWVYVNLQTGHTSHSDDGAWHIAFNRQDVRLRGGDFARGRVGGMVGLTSERLYDIEGNPIRAALMTVRPDDVLPDLTAVGLPVTASRWQLDQAHSILSPDRVVQPDASQDHGWYTEYPTAEQASMAGLPAEAGLRKARDDRGMLVRSAEGNSYARFRLTRIDYQDADDSRSPQTWTFAFDVQPATGH